MPTYRIYYAERQVGDNPRFDDVVANVSSLRPSRHVEYVGETEWEEEVEAKDKVAAVEAFLGDHAGKREEVKWVDDEGTSHAVEGVSDYDPDKTYIWVENDKLMEYQGIDAATPGMVSCPLCEGSGEVDPEVADEFLANYKADDEGSSG